MIGKVYLKYFAWLFYSPEIKRKCRAMYTHTHTHTHTHTQMYIFQEYSECPNYKKRALWQLDKALKLWLKFWAFNKLCKPYNICRDQCN